MSQTKQLGKTSLKLWTSNKSHSKKPKELLKLLHSLYKKNENVEYGKQMSKYMRNQFDFYGIKAPERRKLEKQFHEEELSQAELFALIALCWEENNRDFQMFGIEVLSKKLEVLLPRNDIYDPMELLKTIIVNKSWWDTIDMLATKVLGRLAKSSDAEYTLSTVEDWFHCDNMWLRRTAILHQLGFKKATNKERLFRYCRMCCHENEFFIKKAIGWSLREYAKTHPEAVVKFVKENDNKLSNLSKREALKHIK